MRLDKLTVKSQEALQEAQRLAESKGNQQIDVEHLLYTLLSDGEGTVNAILTRLGVDVAAVQSALGKEIDKFTKVSGATPLGQIYIAPRLKEVFEKAFEQATHLTDE